jgi:hypothetical protein
LHPGFLRGIFFNDVGFGYKDSAGNWVVRNRQEKKDLFVAAFGGLKKATEIDLSLGDGMVVESDHADSAEADGPNKPAISAQEIIHIVGQAPAMKYLKLPLLTPSAANALYSKMISGTPQSVLDELYATVKGMQDDLAKNMAAQLSIHPTLMNLSIGKLSFKRKASCDDFVQVAPEPGRAGS